MNIRNVILDTYAIDIKETKLLELYKIESPDISPDALEQKLAMFRQKWQSGANNPNERVAERNKKHLANADAYEAILRNKKYLKALFDFYKKGGDDEDNDATAFAREFFTALKGAGKTISQKDYNFFMQYFSEERKNEKAILEMLKKDFHAITLKKASGSSEDEPETEPQEKKKGVAIVQTRFHKDSLSLLHKTEGQYAVVQKSQFLMKKYPELSRTMYDFLKMDSMDGSEFAGHLKELADDVFNVRQNDSSNSDEYIPMLEFYRTWRELTQRPDVAGNFFAFKKLTQYPKLTPYLYMADEVNLAYLEMLLKMVRDDYGFLGMDDFLFAYFKPLADGKHYSFTLDKKLEARLKKIGVNPEAVAQDAQRRHAAAKRRAMIPLPLQILRILATWPLCLVQLLFESVRFMVVNVQKLLWAIAIFATVFCTRASFGISIFEALGDVAMNFGQYVGEVVYSVIETTEFNVLTFILGALYLVVKFAVHVLFVPAIFTLFMRSLAKELDRNIDLMGYHKTFQQMQQTIEQQLLYHYKKMGKRIYGKMIWPIAANILTPVAVVLAVVLLIVLIKFLGSNVVLAAII